METKKKKKKRKAWSEMMAVLIMIIVIFLSLIPLSNFLASATSYCCSSSLYWEEIRISLLDQLFTNLIFCLVIILYLFLIIALIVLIYIFLLELIKISKNYKN